MIAMSATQLPSQANKLAKVSGVSTRTLRYYDEIDLLKPMKVAPSGYRIYGQSENERRNIND